MAQIALPGGIPQGPTLAEGFSKGLQQGIGTGISILQFQQQRKQNQQALVMEREKLNAAKTKRQFGQFKLATELLGSDIALNKKLGGEIAYGVIKNNKEMQNLLGVDVEAFNLEEFLTTVTPEVSDAFNKNNAKDLKAVEKGEMSELSFITNFTARLSELPVDDESKKPLQEQAMKTLEDLGAEERNMLARERKGKDLTSELDIKRQGKLSDISAGTAVVPEKQISPELRLSQDIRGLSEGAQKTTLQNILERKGQGAQRTFRVNPDGTMEIIEGEDLGVGFKAQQEKQMQSLYAAQGAVEGLSQEIAGLAKEGDVIGAVGTMQRKIDSFFEQTAAGTRVLMGGEQATPEQLTNPEFYDDVFKGNAAKSAAYKTTALKLGFIIAKINNPDGKISDQDVKLALRESGTDTGSMKQLTASLQQLRKNIQIVVSSTERAMGRKVTTYEAQDIPQEEIDYEKMSLEELEALRSKLLKGE